MKKIVIIVTVLMLIATMLIYVTRDKSPTEEINTPTTNMDEEATFHPDPSSATFTFSDGPITLSAGRNERNVSPESAFVEETVLLDQFAYGDINADKKEDTALLLARYGGGSGTFIYLAAFVSGPITYRGSKATFIGDRIVPQSISIDQGIVTVEYLDRQAGEAFAAEPTILTLKQFVYRAGEFVDR